ncbi:MAG: protein-disulfide reductase DsbD family protein [Myxococcota bacterium]
MRWTSVVAIGAVMAWSATAQADVLGDLGTEFRVALEGGSFLVALGLIFLAGLATSLTPCVYPMIAITVSVFGARQAKSKVEAALLSTAFVGGIAALFTPLGVLSALTGMAFGSPLANPWVVGFLVVLFLAMGLSMFGAFELNLPPALQNRLAQVGGVGYKGAFVIGLVAGVIAAPCTGPVLAVLLSWVGTTRDAGFGALSLFVYSMGLGLLFWVVGTFAVSLPKSGRWLEGVKSAFGVIMLVLAVYFALPLVDIEVPAQRSAPWLVVSIAAVVLGLALGAVHLSFHAPRTRTRVRKGAAIALTVVGVVSAVSWVEALPPGAQITWLGNYDRARERALSESRPMLVDFGAEWCKACKEIEHEALSDPRVVAEAERFVPVRIDLSTGEATPERWALLQEYDQPGLPLVVLHHADGEEAARVTGPVEADRFLDMMRKAR